MCSWNQILSQELEVIDFCLGGDIQVKGVRVDKVIEEGGNEQCQLEAPSTVDHSVSHQGGIRDNHFLLSYNYSDIT